ncbi:MAG TPA: universal stress protein [Stenomitos sp.]
MNIKATLARLDSALTEGRSSRDLLLIPGASLEALPSPSNSDTISLVVGYNGSPRSQAALDLTLLIAYQTRLATRKQVVVQAVYVLEGIYPLQKQGLTPAASLATAGVSKGMGEAVEMTVGVTGLRSPRSRLNCNEVRAAQIQHFEAADEVLWQARSFATEWRGSLNTHLRFGSPAQELSRVAQQEQAHIIVVGCESAEHPLINQLTDHPCCPVVGIPSAERVAQV